ncbi:hypothetical protein NTGM5_60073 [Candidatus Nitrotoga sp. M5]|nr:hypothetical protein NTGM5_60073 [Candidatus Nitrotoga sp. M5]
MNFGWELINNVSDNWALTTEKKHYQFVSDITAVQYAITNSTLLNSLTPS